MLPTESNLGCNTWGRLGREPPFFTGGKCDERLRWGLENPQQKIQVYLSPPKGGWEDDFFPKVGYVSFFPEGTTYQSPKQGKGSYEKGLFVVQSGTVVEICGYVEVAWFIYV